MEPSHAPVYREVDIVFMACNAADTDIDTWPTVHMKRKVKEELLTASFVRSSRFQLEDILGSSTSDDELSDIVRLNALPCLCGAKKVRVMASCINTFDDANVATNFRYIGIPICARAACHEAAVHYMQKIVRNEKKADPQYERYCGSCKTTEGKLLKCGGCKLVYYCSVNCQRKDRNKHATICLVSKK